MQRQALVRLLLSELAKPRWEKRFGPSSWELRALLQQQGVRLASAELLELLAEARTRGWVRYQSPPPDAPRTTLGNIRITPEGRAWLASAPVAGPDA